MQTVQYCTVSRQKFYGYGPDVYKLPGRSQPPAQKERADANQKHEGGDNNLIDLTLSMLRYPFSEKTSNQEEDQGDCSHGSQKQAAQVPADLILNLTYLRTIRVFHKHQL